MAADNNGGFSTVMPYASNNSANANVNTLNAATFIPEIWSDEIIASYEKSLKLSPLVKKMSMKGKKGDTIRLPVPGRGAVTAHTQGNEVNIQSNVEGDFVVVVDRHFEYSRLVDDIVEVQAFSSLRSHYTADAGYQHAKAVDTAIADMFVNCNPTGTHTAPGSLVTAPADADWVASTGTFIPDGTDGSLADYAVAGTTNAFTDQTFRDLIQTLDDRDVPMDGRVFVIPPVLRNVMMGTDRFVSSDYSDQQAVKSGRIGSLYGIDIYVSTNCPTQTAGGRVAFFFHKDCILHVEQMGVRTQTQYKQEYLSTLFTADTLYGLQVYRPESGIALVVPE